MRALLTLDPTATAPTPIQAAQLVHYCISDVLSITPETAPETTSETTPETTPSAAAAAPAVAGQTAAAATGYGSESTHAATSNVLAPVGQQIRDQSHQAAGAAARAAPLATSQLRSVTPAANLAQGPLGTPQAQRNPGSNQPQQPQQRQQQQSGIEAALQSFGDEAADATQRVFARVFQWAGIDPGPSQARSDLRPDPAADGTVVLPTEVRTRCANGDSYR